MCVDVKNMNYYVSVRYHECFACISESMRVCERYSDPRTYHCLLAQHVVLLK